jgi:hypothetical protein
MTEIPHMSTAQQVPASTSPLERRFYPRVTPRTATFIAFEENNRALLLNVSENGLLVSIPAVLPRNFVARALVSLNGLPTPVRVSVRVIWVSEGREQAGIQLLDLSDHDREQIRKWGAQQSAPSAPTGVPSPCVTAEQPSTTPSLAAHARASFGAAPLNRPPGLAPPRRRLVVRTRSTSAAAGIVTWAVPIALVCFAAVFWMRHGTPGNLLSRSAENLQERTAAPSPEIPDNPQSPDAPEPSAAASHEPSPPNSDATSASSESAPPRPSAPRHRAEPSPDEDATALDGTSDDGSDPQVSVLDTPATRREVPPTNSIPSSAPTSQNNALSDVSRPAALTQFDARNDLSRNHVVPDDDRSKTVSNTPSSPAAGSVPQATARAVPNPAARQTLPNPIRTNEVFPSASTMLYSSPIIASTRPASSRRSDASVIQMDAPGGQVVEIRPNSRFHSSFFNLPGERVLESPSITMHIQRSVRMPPAHGWWPFNRNKKVVVGELVSRVDPQGAQLPVIPGDTVRVNATVSADGRIENVRPINGPASLVPAVVKAIHEWRYQPTLLDNKPVETECYVVVQFHSTGRVARQ